MRGSIGNLRRTIARRLPALSLFAVLVVIAGGLASTSLTGRDAPNDNVHVTLVYVGAEDCGPCQAWARDYRPALLASPQFPRITYREIRSPHLLDLLDDRYWPEDLRSTRDRLGKDAAVPLWLILADDRTVMQVRGVSEWRTVALPKLAALLGRPLDQP